MRKVAVILLLLSSAIITMPAVHGVPKGPIAVEEWFQKLSRKKETITKLHYYFHDTVSGKNPTSITVANANNTFHSPTFFGLVNMCDDPLTVGPERNSTILGRAQGFYGAAGLEEFGLLMAMNLVFTGGNYNGSTLSLLGRNCALEMYREMSIVGGTGVFRLARGIATAKTYSFDLHTGDAIVEYNVIVLHY